MGALQPRVNARLWPTWHVINGPCHTSEARNLSWLYFGVHWPLNLDKVRHYPSEQDH